MGWINTTDKRPLAYKTGDWDGKNSDKVVVETKSGKRHLAYFNEVILDGEKFEYWYTVSGWEINEEIVAFVMLPD